MAEKKQDSFVVNDRRLFTTEGELRKDVTEETVTTSQPAAEAAPVSASQAVEDPSVPPK